MNLIEFYEAVEADKDFEGIDVDTTLHGGSVRVKGPAGVFLFSVNTVLEHDWDELRAVLTGERGPEVLTHMTRIVGYYSQTSNWNKSKLGELRDRQKGNYDIGPEARAETADYMAGLVKQAVLGDEATDQKGGETCGL